MSNRRKHTVKKSEKKAVKVATSETAEFNGLSTLDEIKEPLKREKKTMSFEKMKAIATDGKIELAKKLRGI